jgi:hypothetical protein
MKGKIRPKGKIKGKILTGAGNCPVITNIDGGNDPAAIPDTINGYLNGGTI